MIVTARSSFHPGLSRSFRVPSEHGTYYRRCPLACNGQRDRKTGIQIHCGCGFPVRRTDWDCPAGFVVHAEWTPLCGSTIAIVVEPDFLNL